SALRTPARRRSLNYAPGKPLPPPQTQHLHPTPLSHPPIARSIANPAPRLQRRRAQNRASQRAFRERKEKYVADLQNQLHELETRNRQLQKSHSDLDRTNDRLQREVERLKEELQSLKVDADQSIGDLLVPGIFEEYFQAP
ncbi:MAG: hypothetical protein LQ347_005237, partial [Umbilicaria vellea]